VALKSNKICDEKVSFLENLKVYCRKAEKAVAKATTLRFKKGIN